MADHPAPRALIVALSGCSSSGKTTLARLLRDIFPHTFILHEDDFYRPENDELAQLSATVTAFPAAATAAQVGERATNERRLPSRDGVLDWDCAESLDIPAMAESLAYIRQHAAFPPTLDSKEDQNSVGKCPVPDAVIQAQRDKVAGALPASHPLRSAGGLRLCLLDGFLLFSPSMAAIQPSLDIKLFLTASYAKAKARREARDGYVTLEGFWADPPGYVDKIVWPNYVREHAWMFKDGNVEGEFDDEVLETKGIKVQKGAGIDADIAKTLEWTVDTILEELQKQT